MNLDEIGTAFMLRRKQLGWSQTQLAIRTDLSRAEISMIELSKGNPTIITLSQIARVLGCSLKVTMDVR